MKLGFFEIEGWEEKIIRAEFPNDDVFVTSEKLDFQSPPQIRDFDGISIFIDSKITKEALSLFQNLKFITTRTTGFDHVDLVSCAEKGISVAYVPGYGDNTVAEFAFGLLLNLTRKIYQAIDRVKETGSFSLAGLRGMDIKGKTIGKASVSKKHANFVVNEGGARAEDIVMLVGLIKEYVHRKYDLHLEEEIQYVGF